VRPGRCKRVAAVPLRHPAHDQPDILFNGVLQLVLCVSYFTQAQVIESQDIGGPGTSTWFYVQYLYTQASSS